MVAVDITTMAARPLFASLCGKGSFTGTHIAMTDTSVAEAVNATFWKTIANMMSGEMTSLLTTERARAGPNPNVSDLVAAIRPELLKRVVVAARTSLGVAYEEAGMSALSKESFDKLQVIIIDHANKELDELVAKAARTDEATEADEAAKADEATEDVKTDEAARADEAVKTDEADQLTTTIDRALALTARLRAAHNTISEGTIELNKILTVRGGDGELEAAFHRAVIVESRIRTAQTTIAEDKIGLDGIFESFMADFKSKVDSEAESEVNVDEVKSESKTETKAETDIVLAMIHDEIKKDIKRILMATTISVGWDASIPQIIEEAMPAMQTRIDKAVGTCLASWRMGRRPCPASFVKMLRETCMQSVTATLYASAAEAEP